MRSLVLIACILIVSLESYSAGGESCHQDIVNRFQSNIANSRGMRFFWDQVIDNTYKNIKNPILISMINEWAPENQNLKDFLPSTTGAIKLDYADNSVLAKLDSEYIPDDRISKIQAGRIMCNIHVLSRDNDFARRSAKGDGFKFKLKFQNRKDESRSIIYSCNSIRLADSYYSWGCNNNVYYECISEYGNDIIHAKINGYVPIDYTESD